MTISMNLHPEGKWENIRAYIYGAQHGACIVVNLSDDYESATSIAIHYGGEENKEEFIKMMQEAFAKLTQREEEKKDG